MSYNFKDFDAQFPDDAALVSVRFPDNSEITNPTGRGRQWGPGDTMDLIIIVFLSLGGIVLKPGKCYLIKAAGNYRNLRQLRCFRFRRGRGAQTLRPFRFIPTMTQAEAATLLEVSPRVIWKWLHGEPPLAVTAEGVLARLKKAKAKKSPVDNIS